jgi:hypothetical protein
MFQLQSTRIGFDRAPDHPGGIELKGVDAEQRGPGGSRRVEHPQRDLPRPNQRL